MVPILWLNIALMYWAHLIKRGSAIQSSLWISLVRQGGDLPVSRGQLNTSSISLEATRRAAINVTYGTFGSLRPCHDGRDPVARSPCAISGGFLPRQAHQSDHLSFGR